MTLTITIVSQGERKNYHVLRSKIQAKLRVVCVTLKSKLFFAPPAILKGCFIFFSSLERKSNIIAMFLFSFEGLRDTGYYSFKTGGKCFEKRKCG